MGIINAIKNDPGMDKVKLTERFERLHPVDKAAVLDHVKEKKESKYKMSHSGEEFLADPLFLAMLATHKQNKPGPNMSGLMQVIRKFVGDPDEDKESLNPEYSHRVGGDEGGSFDSKFEQAFKMNGARGIAALHRNMFRSSSEYQKFLDDED